MGGLCGKGVQTILWAWALDAPSFVLPDNIAFKIGPSAKLNYLLLEVESYSRVETVIHLLIRLFSRKYSCLVLLMDLNFLPP